MFIIKSWSDWLDAEAGLSLCCSHATKLRVSCDEITTKEKRNGSIIITRMLLVFPSSLNLISGNEHALIVLVSLNHTKIIQSIKK